MADLYGTTPSSNQEDISSYFQSLHNSSSSSPPPCMTHFIPSYSSSSRPENISSAACNPPENGQGFSGSRGGASQVESSSGVNMDFSDPGSFFKENVENGFFSLLESDSNVSSKRKVVSSENYADEFSCDSEGPEASQVPLNPPRPKSSSKRSRAAEVHNLSEKRRRSRINEKMKALQSLIPNSNKTDKASMLDEAIEYLKQLQLQVQMLTMKNGLGLPPMCLSGAMQPVQLPHMGRAIDNRMTRANQESSLQTAYSLPNMCTPSSQPTDIASLADMSNVETSYGFDLPVQAQFEQLNSSESSKEISREYLLPQVQVDTDRCSNNPSSGIS